MVPWRRGPVPTLRPNMVLPRPILEAQTLLRVGPEAEVVVEVSLGVVDRGGRWGRGWELLGRMSVVVWRRKTVRETIGGGCGGG